MYLALNQFERRRPYRHLEPGLQRDIKALCGDYTAAQAQARDLLFSIRDTQAIADAAREAAERGLGWLEPGESLQLPAGLVEQLPPLLRVYVGCAAALYGDYREADLVKIHIGSGKLSLLRYDAFADRPLPRLVERVKIRLREQDIDFFAYGDETDFPSPYLYRKSRYINEEFPHYPEQVAFEEALDALGLFDLSGFGPSAARFDETLARRRWVVDGFSLRRPETGPDLDAPCGRFLTFRQLIECGETQGRTGLPNLPRRPQTWDALQDLAEQVLDPVIDWFGMIRLTYGFCSPELAREIPARIDPRLDQHAAHEHNRLGKPICARLGAAVDFIVADEDMREVARWVAEHTPFDRLYFYGPDLPIHVSYGPDHSRQVVRMVPTANGRLVPRVVAAGELYGSGWLKAPSRSMGRPGSIAVATFHGLRVGGDGTVDLDPVAVGHRGIQPGDLAEDADRVAIKVDLRELIEQAGALDRIAHGAAVRNVELEPGLFELIRVGDADVHGGLSG